jgi:hypothetical protein
MRKIRVGIVVLVALLGAGSLASCGVGDQYATSTTDTHVCVFDGSERGGRQLKFQIRPGEESREIDDNDQVVQLPASNRFWMVASDRSIADPGTPNHYLGNDANGVRIQIEGQIRFRFNLERACEWYSLHGRRNADSSGDLGFNARGDSAASSGWFRFGNENFVVTMQEVISEVGSQFDAELLHYNLAGEDGVPARQALSEALGEAYTERLIENLGGDFFCGTAEATADNPCPEITFQVRYAGPGNDSPLVTERDREEATRRALEREAAEAELRAQQLANQLAAERGEQELLAEQAQTAELEAQIATATCRIYASFGLDCQGNHPTYVVPGQVPPAAG